MLSLEECRKYLLETECSLSDEELLKLRDQIYGLAELALDDYFNSKIKPSSEISPQEIVQKEP